MALDGIVVAALADELNTALAGTRISKISQPEDDELMLTLKGSHGQLRLTLSANASLPLAYLTEKNKTAPMTAPNFCMLLRKHIANGRIISVTQPGLERVLVFEIEHLDELGDLRRKRLILEIMGKHSNLIFIDENDMILDSIKHISAQVSSVREVLPGRQYFIPSQKGKKSPLEEKADVFIETVSTRPTTAAKAVSGSYIGFSPLMANELCFRAGIDGDAPCASVGSDEWQALAARFISLMEQVNARAFDPHIYRSEGKPAEFAAVALCSYADCEGEACSSISRVLETFYGEKNIYTRIRQKSTDLRHIVSVHLDRARKKYDLQMRQLADTGKRDKYRLYGELINTWGYNIPEGAKSFEALDYYDNETIVVPLDPTLTPQENSQKYFAKYGKLKRTCEALTKLTEETRAEVEYLESVAASMDIAASESDLSQIRDELTENGYIRRRSGKKRTNQAKSKPYHYRTADGYDIYVGKNNYQNDELTFKFAEGNDWWFHAKKMPGSHVIAKTKTGKLPDSVFEAAASLAAYYSRGRESDKVEIDYVQKKQVKKPAGARPGFVVYYTNYSMIGKPDTGCATLISD
ncbi:MAG: NFACT family protein [Clostridiales bacterium]|nr:NFACT family protein [Clostridiales bacterium]